MFGGEQPEYNGARDRTNTNHIDQILRGHRQDRRGCSGCRAGLGWPTFLAFCFMRHLCRHWLPQDGGSGALGGPTRTLSLSRLTPRSTTTFACARASKLKQCGKPKPTRVHGLHIQRLSSRPLQTAECRSTDQSRIEKRSNADIVWVNSSTSRR